MFRFTLEKDKMKQNLINKNKIEEIKDLLIKSFYQFWERTPNLNEEDYREAFFKHIKSKLSYMKEEGFIDFFAVKEVTIDDLKD